ncbi:hypothetical protein [Bacillus mycoides]|uniref:hypothetical protein n=1 Tax=Bacillus mycoides TaxID=1405 RepID=UPI0035561B9F
MNLSTTNIDMLTNKLVSMTTTADMKINVENIFSVNLVIANWKADGRKLRINSKTLDYNGRL